MIFETARLIAFGFASIPLHRIAAPPGARAEPQPHFACMRHLPPV